MTTSYTQQVYDFLASNPGANKQAIGEAVPGVVKLGTLLWRMNKQGTFKTEHRDGERHFFINAGATRPSTRGGSGRKSGHKTARRTEPVERRPVLEAPAVIKQIEPVVTLDSIVNMLADTLANQVMSKLQHALNAHVQHVVQQPPKKLEAPAKQSRLPRIGVCGLLPQQAGQIQTEFCDTYDIIFWNDRNGDGSAQLKSLGISCEMVFLHVQHMRHTTESTLRSAGAKFTRVNGGVSQMSEAITKYYVENSS